MKVVPNCSNEPCSNSFLFVARFVSVNIQKVMYDVFKLIQTNTQIFDFSEKYILAQTIISMNRKSMYFSFVKAESIGS